jgi:bisphosphoglycerate-dependent phosphoglycerate mutase
MPKIIRDQFSKLKVPNQRRWQLRQKAHGKCTSCTKPAVKGDYCMEHYLKHKEVNRNAMRRRLGWEV